MENILLNVSVPLWGLFNLTFGKAKGRWQWATEEFPSPYGDYLI